MTSISNDGLIMMMFPPGFDGAGAVQQLKNCLLPEFLTDSSRASILQEFILHHKDCIQPNQRLVFAANLASLLVSDGKISAEIACACLSLVNPVLLEGLDSCPDSISSVNHLNDQVLNKIFGFAVGSGSDFLQLILVCKQWKRVAEAAEHSIKEIVLWEGIEAAVHTHTTLVRRRRTKEGDKLLFLAVLEALNNPKCQYYRKKRRAGASQHELQVIKEWPRLKCRVYSTLYTFFYDRKRVLAEAVKQYFKSLASEVVEKMQRAVVMIHDRPSTTSYGVDALRKKLLNEWQRWHGVSNHVRRIVCKIERDFCKNLEIFVKTTMASSIVQSTTAPSRKKRRGLDGDSIMDCAAAQQTELVQELVAVAEWAQQSGSASQQQTQWTKKKGSAIELLHSTVQKVQKKLEARRFRNLHRAD